MFDLGSDYPAAFDVYDDTGLLANAATVTLTITLPDGTTATPTVDNPPASTGQYRVSYQTTMPGRHIVRWVTTNPDRGWTDEFNVAEAEPPSIFSLAGGKKILGIDLDDTRDDDELRAKIAAITKAVEEYKCEAIVRKQYTKTVVMDTRPLRLDWVPVISLDSVAAKDGSYTWDVNNLYADPDTGLVSVVSGPSITGWVVVTWTAGYQVIPYNYIEGAKVILQHEWESRQGPGTVGEGVIGPEESMDYRHYDIAIPRKAKEWLGAKGIPIY